MFEGHILVFGMLKSIKNPKSIILDLPQEPPEKIYNSILCLSLLDFLYIYIDTPIDSPWGFPIGKAFQIIQ